MRWEDYRQSDNIEDRRSSFPIGRRGLGFGSVLALSFAGYMMGIDPSYLITGAEILSEIAAKQATTKTSISPTDQTARFVSAVLAQTEDTWHGIFEQSGKTYHRPRLVVFTHRVDSACGLASAATGPFYCPPDRKIYLDLEFFHEMQSKFNAPGDFAAAYVIAHEVGHHIQNMSGILQRAERQKRQLSPVEANRISVRVELQADCLAGVWAHHADSRFKILEQGDLEEAINAAAAIGDDRLQRRARGYAVPDSFTHGTSRQRMQWFQTGLRTGSLNACDTFSAPGL